jgi:hypothetical protein
MPTHTKITLAGYIYFPEIQHLSKEKYMVKKGLLVLIIVVFVAGGAFAQKSFLLMAKNTVTIDVGPTIAGFVAGPLGSMAAGLVSDDISDIKSSGFSIAAQYERQIIMRQLSIAVRGVYGMPDVGFKYKNTANPDLDITSIAGEGHVRFYPLGETFFVDGMVGYARLSADLSGSVLNFQIPGKVSASSNYFKFGGKVGWRMSFGDNGGFTFEPAIGYYAGIPIGDGLGNKLSSLVPSSSGIEEALSVFESFVLIGGPRISLAFGYRF